MKLNVGQCQCTRCGRVVSLTEDCYCNQNNTGFGYCLKHPSYSMIDCPICKLEKELNILERKEIVKEEKFEKRMYVLVNRSLSPMQKGIQALHAVVEYGLKYPTTEYFEWANEYKTVIVLDGGTSNEDLFVDEYGAGFVGVKSSHFIGNMENQFMFLSKELNMNVALFKEPDVNNCLTAIAFIVDERVYNYEKYPEKQIVERDGPVVLGRNSCIGFNDDFIPGAGETDEHYYMRLGGERNVKLREFLKQFKLAL